MMPSTFRVLTARELRRVGGRFLRPRRLGAVLRDVGVVVAPGSDATIHDYAGALILGMVRWRPWQWRNRKAAFTSTVMVYRVNLYDVVDADKLGRLVADADHGTISPGALSVELEGVSRRAD